MGNLLKGAVRASSFLRKEIYEIIRQPRLVGTLVLGPFLILFIFGIGYRNVSPTKRTLFVTPPGSPISVQNILQNGTAMGALIYSGTTANQTEALDRLRNGQVDLVIVEPGDAASMIKNNQQAVITLYHHEIDPAQVSYVEYLGGWFADAANQQVLRAFAVEGQKDAVNLHTSLQEAHQNVSAMRQAIQTGNETLAQQKQQQLAANLQDVSQTAGAYLSLMDNIQPAKSTNEASADPVMATLDDLRQNTDLLGSSTASEEARLTSLDKTEKDVTALDSKLAEFQTLDPAVIISPFRSETKSLASIQPSIANYVSPAVLALLLQHLAVTFAALSIVRERNAGTIELFRVSPLSAAEALFGKYISYMLFGGLIAAILSALLVFVLHMPMLGNWWYFSLVLVIELFTSLGIGFAISIVSQTDSQAVQYSMITLLSSVFFSGFIMSLDMFWGPVKVVSWLLPATYGTYLLRGIALNDSGPDWAVLGGLLAIGLVLMLISWGLMRRLISLPR
jgi:ABC-2 type transport system permease protein